MDSIHRPIASYATPHSQSQTSTAVKGIYSYLQLPRSSGTQSYSTSTTSSNIAKQKCILPYAGVDLRKLPWEKVIEIMEKQAEVYKLYQINAACGYEWANQQNREYIETFNAQFKIEMERQTDPKRLPSFITKCISANEFYSKKINNSTTQAAIPLPNQQTIPNGQTQIKEHLNKENTPPRKRKRSEPIYKGTDELKLLLQKERRVIGLDPPVYRFPPPSASLLNFPVRNTKAASSTVPVVAKFKIERYKDNNNCEFFDLTADTDMDESRGQNGMSAKIAMTK